MYEVLRPYVGDFVVKESVKIFCFECQAFVSDAKRESRDENGCAIMEKWTGVWTCPQGHQLYYEEHEVRMHYGKNLPKGKGVNSGIPPFLRSHQTKR